MQIYVNRLLAFEEIVAKYGGPPSLWEKLRVHLPVWSLHDGRPVYLESEVDGFLKAYHRRTQPAAQPAASPYLTTQEAADYLKAKVQSVYDWVKRGKLHPAPGRRGLFTREALDRFAQTRRRH